MGSAFFVKTPDDKIWGLSSTHVLDNKNAVFRLGEKDGGHLLPENFEVIYRGV